MTLVESVQGIITKPKETWPVLAAEPQTVGSLYTGYVIPLAAIGPIAGFIGASVLGLGFLRPSMVGGIVHAVISFVLALVVIFICAFVAQALAPSFGGTKDQTAALKLVAYSATPSWVAGILLIFPPLAIIAGLVGLYGIYLFYLGTGPVLSIPADKAAVYTLVVIVVEIVLTVIVAAVVAAIIASMALTTGMMYR